MVRVFFTKESLCRESILLMSARVTLSAETVLLPLPPETVALRSPSLGVLFNALHLFGREAPFTFGSGLRTSPFCSDFFPCDGCNSPIS